jgi:hypothetical protein
MVVKLVILYKPLTLFESQALLLRFLTLRPSLCLGHLSCSAAFLLSCILLFGLDHAMTLKVRIMTMGSFALLDLKSVYRIVYKLQASV